LVNWYPDHDHAVGVIVNGELVFASEEERWTRHKHSPGEPPINALKQALLYLRRKYGIKPKDVDAYVVNSDLKLLPIDIRRWWLIGSIRNLSGKIKTGLLEGGFITAGLRIGSLYLRGDYLDIARRFVRFVIRSMGEDVPEDIRIVPVPHHLAHAASAYYFSGFNNATIITVDGIGEFEATVVWRVRDGEFEKIASIPTVYGSLGFLYEGVSVKIGYDIFEGPGKVMGLAPYGKVSTMRSLGRS